MTASSSLKKGSAGGFAAHVMQYLANSGQIDRGCNLRVMTLPDRLIDHNSQDAQLAEAALDANAIVGMAAPMLELDPQALRETREG